MENLFLFFLTTKREKNGGRRKEQSELKGNKQHHLLGLGKRSRQRRKQKEELKKGSRKKESVLIYAGSPKKENMVFVFFSSSLRPATFNFSDFCRFSFPSLQYYKFSLFVHVYIQLCLGFMCLKLYSWIVFLHLSIYFHHVLCMFVHVCHHVDTLQLVILTLKEVAQQIFYTSFASK